VRGIGHSEQNAGVPVRGTQSFVHTLSRCWRQPSLTALEVLWRWSFGIPALLLARYEVMRILAATPVDLAALQRMTVMDPLGASQTLAQAMAVLLPAVWGVAIWMFPLLLAVWVVVSSVGRTAVLRRADRSLQARVGTLMVLQTIRIIALGAGFVAWFSCVEWAARTMVTGPMLRGGEVNLVGYSAFVIVTTLGLFTLWAVVSWVLSVAPLLSMQQSLAAGASLMAAFRLGPLKGKLVEINLVMGIVKIALIVLAIVFSATPLPFESMTTPEFLFVWWVGVALLYFVASDFFHVARLVGYLNLWRAFEPARGGD
jgi:hypothetical protein